MKLVFDTNIFISAFAIPHSKAEKAILRILEGSDSLLISKEIIHEVLSVKDVASIKYGKAGQRAKLYKNFGLRPVAPLREY